MTAVSVNVNVWFICISNMAIFPKTKLMQSSPGNVNLKAEREKKKTTKKIQMSIFTDYIKFLLPPKHIYFFVLITKTRR